MSTQLGGGGDLPIGNTKSIKIPSESASQNELRTSKSIPLQQGLGEGAYQSYEVLAEVGDNTPGYLISKISDQFSILNNKIELINLNRLNSDLLQEGSSNLYYSSIRFDTDFATKTTDSLNEGALNFYFTDGRFNNSFSTKSTDELSEGAVNLYYASSLFDADLATKDSDDISEGSVNLYYTNARAISALDPHTSDNSIHFSDLSGFSTSNLIEGDSLYYTEARFSASLGAATTSDLQEGGNLYYTSNRFSFDFSAKSTDDLSQGAINLYLTETGFDNILALRTTSDLQEGGNLYYTEGRFTSSLSGKNSDDLAQGTTNLYLNSLNFDSFFSAKTTSDITEGSNLYYTDARFDGRLDSKNTDNLQEGVNNKYISPSQANEIINNSTDRHTHSNKALLDQYTQSNSAISNAVNLTHDHSNKVILDGTEESFTTDLKNQYDSLTSGSITTVVAPLELSLGVLSHSNADGNKHVPTNAGISQYWVLASGASQGSYLWTNIEDIVASSGIFEATPSTSTIKGVQSAYLNDHISNNIANIKHVTDANLDYINNTIPAHVASTVLHVPAFSASDNGKFLYINGSTELDWSTSTSIVTTDGESYISASGSNITASKIDLSQTNIAEGSNISFSGNQISAIQRPISGSSISGDNGTSISAGWAYSHEVAIGAGKHLPNGGTVDQYIDGTGAVKDFTDSPGQTYKIVMGPGSNGTVAERIANATFPTGWSGAVGMVTTDLILTHPVGSEVTDVTIFADDGADVTKLVGTAPYTTIIGNQANTEIKIASLTTIREDIRIYIKFL